MKKYRPSARAIDAAAVLFAIYYNGMDNFSNKLRARMYFDKHNGNNHRPTMNGNLSMTNLDSLHLLAKGIEKAAISAWIDSNVAGMSQHFEKGSFKMGTETMASSLASLAFSGNLEKAMSTVASIQTAIVTLPATGNIAGSAGKVLGYAFNTESVGDGALSVYLNVSVEQAVQDFIQGLNDIKSKVR